LEKYTKLIQPKNRKMRKILDAKDSMEEVAEISVDVLKKLKKGQAVNLGYKLVTSIQDAKDGKNYSRKQVQQDAYVMSNENGHVKFAVNGYEVSQHTITKTEEDRLGTITYSPKSHIVDLDLNTGQLTHVIKAVDQDGNPVELKDTTQQAIYDAENDKLIKGFTVSGKLDNKLLT
ncbi:hypothetical protein KJ764_00805, partial [Patescibacteria group bacterium]|nr:hypothetical protein [Patescibacteria group bacterium]